MKELLEYRVFLVKRLREAVGEFCAACESLDSSIKVSGEWTLHQVAFHVRDLNRLVYNVRARKTIEEENPLFENFDPEIWMKEHYDPNESIQKILNELKFQVEDLCNVLANAPIEIWSRESRHEIIGDGLAVQLWVERGLAHLEEHLAEIKAVKNARV